MRSFAIVAAALAATAAASPMKRDEVIVTDVDIDYAYVTDVVTVTAGETATASVVAAETTTTAPVVTYAHYGHHWHSSSSASSVAAAAPSSSSEAVVSSSSSVAALSTYVVASTSSAVVPTYSSASAYSSSVVVVASSSSVASSATAANAATATTYQEAVIKHHNYHRANHSAADITWSDSLASIALEIANSCNYAHDTTAGGGGYGQNIAAGTEAWNISSVVTDGWYNPEVNNFTACDLYGEANPSTDFEYWGHFSQIVWKATTTVGCATVDCTASGLSGLPATNGATIPPFFTVCNYGPYGNVAGEYADNIGDSLGLAGIEWDYGIESDEQDLTGSN